MADLFTRLPPVSPDALHLEEIPREFRDEFTRLMQRIDFLEAESICEQVHEMLIFDGVDTHSTEAFVAEAIDRNIYPICLVLHSSDQCQPLDLVTYGLMRHFMSSGQLKFFRLRQSQKLVRILGVWHQATSLDQVVFAFIATRLVCFLAEDNVLYMRVDRGRATRVRS
jgi:hypothetical protein